MDSSRRRNTKIITEKGKGGIDEKMMFSNYQSTGAAAAAAAGRYRPGKRWRGGGSSSCCQPEGQRTALHAGGGQGPSPGGRGYKGIHS